jgi:hypothetical protein
MRQQQQQWNNETTTATAVEQSDNSETTTTATATAVEQSDNNSEKDKWAHRQWAERPESCFSTSPASSHLDFRSTYSALLASVTFIVQPPGLRGVSPTANVSKKMPSIGWSSI